MRPSRRLLLRNTEDICYRSWISRDKKCSSSPRLWSNCLCRHSNYSEIAQRCLVQLQKCLVLRGFPTFSSTIGAHRISNDVISSLDSAEIMFSNTFIIRIDTTKSSLAFFITYFSAKDKIPLFSFIHASSHLLKRKKKSSYYMFLRQPQ